MAAVSALNVGEEAPAVEAQEGAPAEAAAPAEEQPSGLPSENNDELTPWERARQDGYLPDDAKEDIYELAKSWKHSQDFAKEARSEKDRLLNETKKVENQKETINQISEFIPEFVANGMELTEEMLEKSKELNISEAELKLGAYEYRDRINNIYSLVGGQEEYQQMMTEMSEHMTDEEKRQFNRDIDSSSSKYAVMGLHAEWKSRSNNSGQPQGRVEGKVAGQSGVKGYTSQAEMLRDAGYLRSRKGRLDSAARVMYEKRVAATAENIIYGR